jgi:hypothetical protein
VHLGICHVFLNFRADTLRQGVHIFQSAAGDRRWVFDQLTGGPGWEQVVRDGAVSHVARVGDQAEAHLERAGTFVFLVSATLTAEQVVSIAAGPALALGTTAA